MHTTALSKTLASSAFDLGSLLHRVNITAQLLSALPVEPEGPAIIYEVPGSREVRALPLLNDEVIFGRLSQDQDAAQGCHLAFPNAKKMSARHFRIHPQAGRFILEDLGSKNGTYVNSGTEPVKSKTLVAADIIYAGEIKFAFTGE